MIRFLQTDNRFTKALLAVVIGAASISMVVYLIPGLAAGGATAPDTYAVVYPHWYSRFFSSGDTITQTKVDQLTQNQLQQRGPQYANNPMIVNLFEQQVGQQLVQQQVLLDEAHKLGIEATDNDVRQYLHSGPTGEVLFPNGKFIGQDQYAQLIADRLNMSVKDFEQSIKDNIVLGRLQALITAPVTVSPEQVQQAYRKQNVKIKFNYAVLSADDLAKTINPSQSELEAFFKKNAARYANAVPEMRTISYFAFTPQDLPGGVPQPTQQQIQSYYEQHQSQYQVPEQAKSRHILISVPATASKAADAAAKAKAEMIQKKLENGGSWDKLAKEYSDDPGSKNSGGELGWSQRGRMVPAFDSAIFSQKIGAIGIVKSQFGYHVVQVEARQQAHTQPLSEVQTDIQAALIRNQTAQEETNYAKALTSQAAKNGLASTAAAHHLKLVTTPPTPANGVIPALPDSTQLLQKAFTAEKGAAPADAPTGEGYAIFQVTGVQAAHAPSFADWKSHVLDDYRQEKLPALLAQKTKQLDEQAKNLNDLPKAAKAVGAKMETSDLVTPSGQASDLGAVGQVAPQLFDLNVGNISGPIMTGRTGVVARIVDKQEPTAAEIAQNFDQTREQLLAQQRDAAFEVFVGNVWDNYRKHGQIRINPKTANSPVPGM